MSQLKSYDNLEQENFFPVVFDLLDIKTRYEALKRLLDSGLISIDTLAVWKKFLGHDLYTPRYVNDIAVSLKMRIDELIEGQGGNLAKEKSLGAINPVIELLTTSGNKDAFEVDAIRHHTVLDFGSGVYCPLSVAIILFGNGFSKVLSYEPFPIEVEITAASVGETIKWLLLDPAPFNFSGIPNDEFKKRVAGLDFTDISLKLQRLNSGEAQAASLGPVELIRTLSHLPDACVDLVMSNSVLEHIADLEADMQVLKRILTDTGICVHTVDYSDHRSISMEHIFKMYFDGDLHNINGLRPSQLQAILGKVGFAGLSVTRLTAPPALELDPRSMVKPFSEFPAEDLRVWVRSYVLKKVSSWSPS